MQTAYRVTIYRDADGGDCSNGGASSKFARAMLYREPPEKVPDGYAGFLLDTSPKVGGVPYPRAVPIGEKRWVMFGGNFVWSCDSWFRQEVSGLPIPVHDRVEG